MAGNESGYAEAVRVADPDVTTTQRTWTLPVDQVLRDAGIPVHPEMRAPGRHVERDVRVVVSEDRKTLTVQVTETAKGRA